MLAHLVLTLRFEFLGIGIDYFGRYRGNKLTTKAFLLRVFENSELSKIFFRACPPPDVPDTNGHA